MQREQSPVRVRVAGAGAFVPPQAVTNEQIARAIPGWSAERIAEKLFIEERRFLWELDADAGRTLPPEGAGLAPDGSGVPASNTDMCDLALRRALAMGGVDPKELDAIFVVTCTPDRLNFNHDAMALHHRLGCRTDAFALVVDDGCGGTPYVMDLACRMLRNGTFRTVAVVGSAFTSPLVNREVYTSEVAPGPGRKPLNAYLSMYVFGDGAGAVVLRGDASGDDAGSGVLATMSGSTHAELVLRRAGGQLSLPYHDWFRSGDLAFVIDGLQVARSYPIYMQQCLDAVLAEHPHLAGEVSRYYFHQPNKRVLDAFTAQAGLAPERVASNVQRCGNTSAAGMLILLAQDLEEGTVALGRGDVVLIAAIGANVHYGAQLIRL
ncbi:MAG: 3-oxoacyl-ACP synthase III family protein [Gemmatimonadaceae bacterium]